MRDNITTIPLTEIFEVSDGCPVCRLRDTVEARVVDFILGEAMMEPDVRIKTNELGFCKCHFDLMLSRQNKLAVALMLESHLAEIDKKLFEKPKLPLAKEGYKKKYPLAGDITQTCFICERVQWGMERLLDTLVTTYTSDSAFRKLFEAQPMICLPHYDALRTAAEKSLAKKDFAAFNDAAASLTAAGIAGLREDISWFCRKHDYRNAEEPWGNSKDAIERTVKFLTSR